MQPYPKNTPPDIVKISKNIGEIARLRDQDIIDRNTFPAVFISGRTVNKIPSSSADVAATDRVGDVSFAVDGSFIYYYVNVSGTPEWLRIALTSW